MLSGSLFRSQLCKYDFEHIDDKLDRREKIDCDEDLFLVMLLSNRIWGLALRRQTYFACGRESITSVHDLLVAQMLRR